MLIYFSNLVFDASCGMVFLLCLFVMRTTWIARQMGATTAFAYGCIDVRIAIKAKRRFVVSDDQ
jgi:hypothetical protein